MRTVVVLLLRLYPADFREHFEADMLATFDERWREKRSAWVALRIIVNLLASAAMERAGTAPTIRKNGDSSMTTLLYDLRFAARGLGKSPGFTIVAIVTLALGIGVNAAMFSVAHSVLWRTLPYPEADRLVAVMDVDGNNAEIVWGASFPNVRDWRARSRTVDGLAVTFYDQQVLHMGADPSRVDGASVSEDFFRIMGASPFIGRTFTPDEDRPGAEPVVVLSHSMWARIFAGDPNVAGKQVRFGTPMTVIGVMPEQFDWPPRTEYWVSAGRNYPSIFGPERRDVWVLSTIARLRAGRSLEEAQTEFAGIAGQLGKEYPQFQRPLKTVVRPVRGELGRDLRPALIALLGAVGLVLLIACGNLAGLMMARSNTRVREVAVRAALGAGRFRLASQLLMECAWLAVMGGGAGVALAMWVVTLLPHLSNDPRLANVALDLNVLAFAAAATISTCLLFGALPAIRSANVQANDALRSGVRAGSGRDRARLQQILVTAEVALCVVLLAGAGLLFASFRNVLRVDPGFRTEHLLTIRSVLPDTYTTPAVRQFYARALDRLQALPGASGAALTSKLPLRGDASTGEISIEGRPSGPGELGGASFCRVSPRYFHLLGVPMLHGREFDERDDGSNGPVILINETMARRFWPNADPVGSRIKIGPPERQKWSTIIGVVRDFRNEALDKQIRYATYQPLAESPTPFVSLVLRTTADPATLGPAARAVLREIEPELLIDAVQTMPERIAGSVSPRRLNVVLFGVFAGLALLLSAVGLYGVVAYGVSQRTREFGIRLALGARAGDVLRLVIGEGGRLAIAGVLAGVLGALALTRLLTRLLFEISPGDPLTLAAVAAFVTVVALIACWIPARRATRVAPIEALRSE